MKRIGFWISLFLVLSIILPPLPVIAAAGQAMLTTSLSDLVLSYAAIAASLGLFLLCVYAWIHRRNN